MKTRMSGVTGGRVGLVYGFENSTGVSGRYDTWSDRTTGGERTVTGRTCEERVLGSEERQGVRVLLVPGV